MPDDARPSDPPTIAAAQEAARSAEERWRALFDQAHDTISVLATDGTILDVNGAWEARFGVPRDAARGRHIREFAAPGHADANLAAFRRAVEAGGGRSELVARVLGADGTVRRVDYSICRMRMDGRDVVVGIGRDVTEREEAAARVAASEAKYRALVESIPDVVRTTTMAGEIAFITPSIERLTGFTVDEVRAQGALLLLERIHADDQERVVAAFASLAAEGDAIDLEYRWQAKDGRWLVLRDRAKVTRRDGELLVDGLITDVTRSKALESEVRQSQKMEAIGQLTGGVAHDFNNILASILVNGAFLLDELPAGDPRREAAAEIQAAAERAAQLTRQLLAFSRRQIVAPRLLDLGDVVGGLEKMLRRLIGEDVTFRTTCSPHLLVRADPGQIEQIVLNLVVNARDAMPDGGAIDVRVTGDDGSVVLEVQDTGAGMDEETMRRAFEPFFTTKGPHKGTGLGLSTVYGIVAQSGGRIGVQSEVGRGTTFRVVLPRAAGEQRATTSPAPAYRDARGDETVLVVEDDDRVRAAVVRILKAHGYDVLVARDGDDALALAATCRDVDLVLSDLVMPGRNGIQVVDDLAAQGVGARALFMSGYTEHAALQNGALRGTVAFIQKPFTPAALAARVREVLDG